MINNLHAYFLTACVDIEKPSSFQTATERFVDLFMKEEMDDVVERINLFYKFLNPLARKKFGLLIGKWSHPNSITRKCLE